MKNEQTDAAKEAVNQAAALTAAGKYEEALANTCGFTITRLKCGMERKLAICG